MARSGIRYEDVRRAIATLLQRGETPSVQKIREVLGTGSFTTISEHLRRWRLDYEAKCDIPPDQAIPAPILELTGELWRKAQEAASEGLMHYRQEADQRIEEATRQVQSTLRHAEDAAQREAALTEHLSQVQARLESKSAQHAKLEAEQEVLIGRESRARDKSVQLETQLTRLQEQKEQQTQQHQQALSKLTARHQEQLVQEEQRHEAAEARLMKLLDEARQERQSNDKQHAQRQAQLEKRMEQMETQLNMQRSQLAEEEKQHREATWKLREYQDSNREMKLSQERLEAQLQEKSLELEQCKDKLRDAEAHLAKTTLPPFVY